MQFLQLWILPNKQGLSPSVEQRQYEEADRLNKLLQVLRPVGYDEEGIDVHQDAGIYVSRLEEGNSVQHEIPDKHGGYFYLIQGRLELNRDSLASGDAAYIRASGHLKIAASTTSEFILVDTVL